MAKKELTVKLTGAKQAKEPTTQRKGTFVKGESGNPKGRPIGSRSFHTVFQEAIKRITNKDTGQPITEDDIIYKYAVNALGNDKMALEKLVDRIYGKATDNHKIEGELVIETITGMRIVKDESKKK